MCGSIKPAWGANLGRGESEVYEGREPDFNQAPRFAFGLQGGPCCRQCRAGG